MTHTTFRKIWIGCSTVLLSFLPSAFAAEPSQFVGQDLPSDHRTAADHPELISLWHALVSRSPSMANTMAFINPKASTVQIETSLDELFFRALSSNYCFLAPSYWPVQPHLELLGRKLTNSEYVLVASQIYAPAADLQKVFNEYKQTIIAMNQLRVNDKRSAQLEPLREARSALRQNLVSLAGEQSVAELDAKLDAHAIPN